MRSHRGRDTGDVPPVEESWARIDDWLAEHAPVSHALLRPPASRAAVAAAERRLGLTFPPDLVASLSCHDGTEHHEGAPVFGYHGPFAGLDHLVRDAELLRSVARGLPPEDGEEGPESELNAFWRDEWLLVTRGIGWEAQDGLFVTCRAGSDHGRVGRFFNEDSPSFTSRASLRHLVAAFADSLERRLPESGLVPVAWEGKLLWEEETRVVPDPASPLGMARDLPEPVLPEPKPEPPPTPRRHPDEARLRLSIAVPSRPPVFDRPGLLFVRGTEEDEVLRRMGVLPHTVRRRSGPAARHSAAGAWAASLPMVRVGTVAGWAVAVDEAGPAQGCRPEVWRRVSAGTRAVALWREGGTVRLVVVENGSVVEEETVRTPRADRRVVPGGGTVEVMGADPWPEGTAARGRLLASLSARFGIDVDEEGMTGREWLSGLVLPLLEDLPESGREPAHHTREGDANAILGRAAPGVLRGGVMAQMRRLAVETGLDTVPGAMAALEAAEHREAVPLGDERAREVMLRTVAAEARAVTPGIRGHSWRGEQPSPSVTEEEAGTWRARARAARALRHVLAFPPEVAVAAVVSARLSADWRSELSHDLNVREG